MNNVKFNENKLQYKQKEVCFMGYKIACGNICPDVKYLRAVHEMPVPTNKADVLRVLGLYKFLAKYIPNLSQRTANLRHLTNLNTEWEWTNKHQDEFDSLQRTIGSEPVLTIFEPDKRLTIQTDASKKWCWMCAHAR